MPEKETGKNSPKGGNKPEVCALERHKRSIVSRRKFTRTCLLIIGNIICVGFTPVPGWFHRLVMLQRSFPFRINEIVVGESKIKLYLDRKLSEEENRSLESMIALLKEMSDFLPEEMSSRIDIILLNLRVDDTHDDYYSALSHPQSGVIEINNEQVKHTETLVRIFFHEVTHLATYKYTPIPLIVLSALDKNIFSMNSGILTWEEVGTWFKISEDNGGYLSIYEFSG